MNLIEIEWQLYLMELLGLGILELLDLIYLSLSRGFSILLFFTNLSLMEFQVRYLTLFLLFSVLSGFGWFWIGNLHKNIQLMLEFLKAPVFLFFYYTLMIFLMMLSAVLLSMLMILLSKCDQAFDLWLELAFELESDLRDTMDWRRKWLVDFNTKKTALVLFDRCNNTGAIDGWKWMSLFLRKNHLLRCLGWLSFLNWIGVLTLSLLLKLPRRTLKLWFILWKFFLLRFLCSSINLPFSHARNTVVMSWLVPLGATWIC